MDKSEVKIERPSLANARFMSFRTAKEEWGLYKIEDGSVLRAKVLLTGVLIEGNLDEMENQIKAGQKPKLGLTFRPSNLFAVESPPELRGTPDPTIYPIEELRGSIVKEDMDFETMKETWNLYELENGIVLKMRISPTAISKTNKFESAGMPLYTVDASIDVKVEMPEHIRKLLKEKQARVPTTRSVEQGGL
jgi:hypothetical protein